ncbi:MAG TPA: carbamoylphosphate synthase large subunit [Erysipelotrichaceae bacterium]|nr:ATP-grasp domain-containing protein [Bacillota bacterium]HCY06582.1 carbamoylphosphate synthase large subunit [Erysipelotrichaceae bacterium]
MNVVFISPTFPLHFYQFPRATKRAGLKTFGIAEDHYDSLNPELKNSLDDYYQVNSLENYEEVYRAVAYFSFKYGKIDYIESNNEYWLELDARLRTDFNITSSYNTEDLHSFKLKSGMKSYYEKAGIKVARYHMVSTLEKGKKFIKEVGYPVVVKPDNGVGASATYKLSNDEDLEKFYEMTLPTEYIMEEFVPGEIVSFDGIVGPNSEILFYVTETFTENVMEIVTNANDCIYYTNRKDPENLVEAGRKTIASFKPRNRFFHCEFFRMLEDKPGLAKKGEIIALEVNMRPPGGYTTDLMNYAHDIDVYQIYADMLRDGAIEVDYERKYHATYVGIRDGVKYKNSHEDVKKKYGKNILVYDRLPDILSGAMGNNFYIARFKKEKDVLDFAKFVCER